ncbi:MAG: amino acid permease [Methanothrix sp.]|nr:amino acid permease [Methanothrix sp.]
MHDADNNDVYKMSLSVFTLVTLASLYNIRKFPTLADLHWELLTFSIIAFIIFLIPASLISAELATGWPQAGGVYVWVKEAFGERWGFTAIWLQWFQMTIGFVAALSFIAATLSYVFNPALANSKIYEFIIIVVVWWALTFFNMRGLKTYTLISSSFLIIGMIIPSMLLIGGGLWYIISGNPVQMTCRPVLSDFVPDFSRFNSMVLLMTSVFLFFGIEMTAAHAKEIKDVRRDYPLAILIAGLVITAASIVGSILLAMLVPTGNMNLLAGIMQAFEKVLGNHSWLVSAIALMIAIGSIGEASTWILGPIRGLASTAKEGSLPPVLQKINQNGVPVNMMVLQAFLITFWAAVYVLLPGGVNGSYWMLLSLTSLVYLVMYFFMYSAAIKLRYSHPDVKRAFKIPGGKIGMWLVSGLGIIALLFIFMLALSPPSQISFSGLSPLQYLIFMLAGAALITLVPLIIYSRRKPEWKPF